MVREDYATEQEYKKKRSYTGWFLGVLIKLVLEGEILVCIESDVQIQDGEVR